MVSRKLLLLFLFFILINNDLFGQNKMDFLFFAMPERTFLINKYDKQIAPLAKKTPSYSVTLGAMTGYRINNTIRFSFGFLYSHQAQKSKIYFSNWSTDHIGKTILSYIKVPLLLQFNLVKSKNATFYSQLGPQISLLVIEEGAIFNSTDIIEAGGAYKPMVFDGVVSLGLEIKMKKKLYYTIQLRADHSLHNVNNLNYKVLNNTGAYQVYDLIGNPRSEEYNMTIGLVNGICYKI